ncbi:MAG: hypothetical protein M3Z26_01740 [Bacteroidota bacterium]|nr:hypothetical protein [Bacteroidota bacterium]
MAFPQKQVGKSLYLNVLSIVRNYNPLLNDLNLALSPAWVDCNLRLQAIVINSLEDYPSLDLPASKVKAYDLPDVKMDPSAKDIFTSLQSRFTFKDPAKPGYRSNPATNYQVKKYLPQTYRQSFNFTSPRDKNICVTGDEYHCAVKKNSKPDPAFVQSGEDTSWGKVFAFCLRHKELAKKCGFIHEEMKIDLDDNTYQNGGWLYVDLHPDCSYFSAAQAPNQNFIKRYAARIPKLDLTKQRDLFAAVEFPVLITNPSLGGDDPMQPSSDILDQMFIEAAEYDDGFCKIVHNYQPVSNSLIKEEQDDEHPVTNDIGIRMGWDDEQIAIWHARQMALDPVTSKRADAPPGVFQYLIDARIKSADPLHPNKWTPLCRVSYDKDVSLDATLIGKKNDELEMGVEVYPAQLDADKTGSFWLPSYFSQWIGNSLVLQDEDAIAIYHKDEVGKNYLSPGDYDPPGETPHKATKNDFYKAVGLDKIALLYGDEYEFRVRMADITGGGPAIDAEPVYSSPAPFSSIRFLRHVIPQTLNFVTPLPVSDTVIFTDNKLSVKRPLLGYPSVIFTGGYTDTVQKLIDDSNTVIGSVVNNIQHEKRDVGLYDPDVASMEIIVEVRSLGMDTTIRKRDAKDNFAFLYSTKRAFPKSFDGQLDVKFTFVDAPVLDFTGSPQLTDLGLHTSGKTNIDDRSDLVLPNARDIRITVRALTEDKPDYFGGVNPDGTNRTQLTGMVSSFVTRNSATSEKNLFKPTGDQMMIRGIYLQPDDPLVVTADLNQLIVANLATDDRIPTMIQRLSGAIGTDNKGMSLIGKQGQRWQFGVSRTIRHTAAPDNTSITFATKSDLLNHWIVPITLLIDRDWTWDGVQPTSIEVYRQNIFLRDAMKAMGENDRDTFLNKYSTKDILTNAAVTSVMKELLVGDIELKRAINIQALVNSDRSQTYVCFIDGVEPKQSDPTKFPDELLVSYRVNVNYLTKNGSAPTHDDDLGLYLHLPITSPPSQMPKIVSAGLAASKYVRDTNYANTESRKKYLWIEFEEPLQDPDDAYLARMLAYSPDPLLAKWEWDLLIAPQEPALPIDPEPMRIITSASSDEKSGLNAMQEMIAATDSNVHYLVPLPPGLHADSTELFGFFTYEFRVGHKIPWSTAQGRFGRPLHNTGVQHPAPQLYCTANRDERLITVTAPFAQTVFDGRNVTAIPPRTEIWALLYAQIRMADDSDERNVLLADKKLFVPKGYTPGALAYVATNHNQDAPPQGTTGWRNKEVEDLLALYGLPAESPLSVLCVEMMPGNDNFIVNQDTQNFSHQLYFDRQNAMFNHAAVPSQSDFINNLKQYLQTSNGSMQKMRMLVNDQSGSNNIEAESYFASDNNGPRPLTSDLGNYRILRTSTLVAVPEVCCTV